jgi:hypothetical protein
MLVKAGDLLRLNLDCVAMVEPRVALLIGWALTPRGAPSELAVEDHGQPLDIAHVSFHPRPDLQPPDAGMASASGFVMLVRGLPEGMRAELVLRCGPTSMSLDLAGPAVARDPLATIAGLSWAVALGLFQDVATMAALGPLLGWQGRRGGIFAEWLGRLPLIAGRAAPFGALAEATALASPAGDVLLRFALPGLPASQPMAACIALMDHAAQVPGESLGFARAGQAAVWLRLPAPPLGGAARVDLVVNLDLLPGQPLWMRVQPRLVPATLLLTALAEAAGGLGHDVPAPLADILARREAAFLPRLRATAPVPPPGGKPALLLLGLDDPQAVRLLQAEAARLEARFSEALLLGEAAEAAARMLARRGRLPVRVGAEARAALAGPLPGGALPLDMLDFAEAVIAGTPDAAFGARLDEAQLARRLALHGMVGAELAPGAVLAGDPPAIEPGADQAGIAIGRHLRALWQAAEGGAHG